MSLLNRPIGKEYLDVTDAMSGMPPQSRWAKWFGGLAFPLIPMWGALHCWIQREGFFPGQNRIRYELTGMQAVVLGFLLFDVAAFLHFHYFWGNSRQLNRYMEIGKVASGILAVGSILYLVWFMATETFTP